MILFVYLGIILIGFVLVNNYFFEFSEGMEIFIVLNEVYVDIIVLKCLSVVNWDEYLLECKILGDIFRKMYVVFGWGD